jgi:hypothetical protein
MSDLFAAIARRAVWRRAITAFDLLLVQAGAVDGLPERSHH